MTKFNFFLIFLLAHFTGDFVFQTNKIARIKSLNERGLIIHTGIMFVVQTLFLSIFGSDGLLVGALGSLVHFFIDHAKNLLNRYFTNLQFILFVLDQALHICLIWLLTILLAPESDKLINYLIYIRLLTGIIILVYISTIAAKMLVRDLNPCLGRETFFKKHERPLDALAAVILWSVWFLPPALSIVLIPGMYYLYYRCQKIIFDYNAKISLAKYFIFALAGCLTFVFTNLK